MYVVCTHPEHINCAFVDTVPILRNETDMSMQDQRRRAAHQDRCGGGLQDGATSLPGETSSQVGAVTSGSVNRLSPPSADRRRRVKSPADAFMSQQSAAASVINDFDNPEVSLTQQLDNVLEEQWGSHSQPSHLGPREPVSQQGDTATSSQGGTSTKAPDLGSLLRDDNPVKRLCVRQRSTFLHDFFQHCEAVVPDKALLKPDVGAGNDGTLEELGRHRAAVDRACQGQEWTYDLKQLVVGALAVHRLRLLDRRDEGDLAGTLQQCGEGAGEVRECVG